MTNDIRDRLTLRAARPADAEAIALMMDGQGYRRNTMRLPFQAPEAVRRWLETPVTSETRIVATHEAAELIGMATMLQLAGRRVHVGQIGMGVHDAWIGRRVGTALMAALVDLADNWLSLRRLELDVLADNMLSLALYERFGFEREGLRRDFVFREGRYVDAVAMARVVRSARRWPSSRPGRNSPATLLRSSRPRRPETSGRPTMARATRGH